MEDPPDVFVTAFATEIPGYPIGLAIDRVAWTEPVQPRLIRLARHLANSLDCRSMCDGTGAGPTESAYWSIVWIDDEPWLADDSGCDETPPRSPELRHRIDRNSHPDLLGL